jgi:hypothetical protein
MVKEMGPKSPMYKNFQCHKLLTLGTHEYRSLPCSRSLTKCCLNLNHKFIIGDPGIDAEYLHARIAYLVIGATMLI